MTASSTPQNVLFAPTPATPTADAFAALVRALTPGRRIQTQGVKGAARGYVLAKLSRSLKAPLICVTEDEESADQLAGDLSLFFGGEGSLLEPSVLRLPGDDVLPDEEVTADMDVVSRRLGALFHMRQGTRFSALVLSARALAQKVVPPDTLNSLSELIGAGQDIHRDAFARRLVEMGYHAAPLVEDVGTFSVRGDIVDVFSPLYTRPVRLELFGDTIESIRAFDPETQRTTDNLETLYLPPARELLLSESTRPRMEAALREAAERLNLPTTQLRERLEQLQSGVHASAFRALLPALFQPGLATVLDYLPFWNKAPVVYLDAPVAIERAWTDLWSAAERAHASSVEQQEPSLPPNAHFASAADLTASLGVHRTLEGGGLSLAKDAAPVVFGFGTTQDLREAIRSHHGEEGALQPLVDRLVRWRDARIAAVVVCGSAGQVDRLKRLLLERDISARVHAEMPAEPGALFSPDTLAHLVVGEASSGFVDGSGGLALLTDEEIFGARARRKATRSRRMAPFEAAFRDLKEGELIVHTDFGIGRYLGMTTMVVNKLPGDFLVLEYAGKDKVYLPVSRMRLIQKFTGGDPDKVALDRLGTQSWEKTKKRVKENLLKMAAELVQLYAARKAHPGHVFSAPDRYFHQFEADFEFEETPDQAKAIADVIADMQKSEPMDRLVCGDVGYGKTEVAMRAAFKAALDKKQVAVLVPTTVLAQQHFHTFQRRFRDYPVTVDVVSGMRKPQEVRDVLERARTGKVDIVVGTHKLLSPQVAFKDLGLLIVDEEQRFGVKQKEQIKRLRTQVDVLTLTATPIPRTLNMAMSGLRDLSIIATPPEDRRAIRTFVQKFDPGVIREALARELARGGQAFFVHNRVDSIASIEQLLKELLPNVSIGVAHGQMPEGELEKVMLAFVEKKHQVLLCTSIIESGLDIPSANTMVVNRADTFGLAQLYQLRGRVGRSRERAYAYLLVPARKTITKDAERRLEVLQAFTELGAGFSIASHDLEIRGAGNLLGPDQSGAIAAIGFDLYTQLLDEAVSEMRGEPPRVDIEPDVNLPIAALLPDDYVPDVHQRLVMYKRFASASSEEELDDLRAELVDRYGDSPPEADHLCELMRLKVSMRELQLRTLDSGPGRLVVTLGADARLDPAKLAAAVQKSKGSYRLTPEMKLIATIPQTSGAEALLSEARRVLADLTSAALQQ